MTRQSGFWLKALLLGLIAFTPVMASAVDNAPTAPPAMATPSRGLVINEPLPRPTGYERFVVDKAGVLSAGFKAQLTQQLALLDQQGQAQITVVTLPDTDRELSDLAPTWFNNWGVGHKDRDDGILVLVNQARVATGQSGNRVFVSVGTGVQGTLPDGRVGQLIRDYARPGLNSGNTEVALEGLMPQLIKILSEEPIKAKTPQGGQPDWLVIAVILFILFNLFRRRGGGMMFLPGFGGGFFSGGGGDWGGGSFGGGSSDGGGSGD